MNSQKKSLCIDADFMNSFKAGFIERISEGLLICLEMETWRTPMLGILFLLCWIATIHCAETGYVAYKDPYRPVDVRVNDLLNRMTLAEKIGQMTQIERKNSSAQVLKDYFIGEY